MAFQPTVGVAVITYKAVKQLPACLPPLLASPLKPRVLVVNSSSNDGTVELARQMGAETLVHPRHEFNHGGTREMARKALGTDIVVMITPDAIAQGPDMIEKLIRPLAEGRAAAAYARQLPHDGAGFFEAFAREYNYPAVSELRGIEDAPRYGSYTFFCSDSCAAWSNSALDAVGGFDATLSLEDTIAVAKLLHAGHKVAYVADALVKHSHFYPPAAEFRHYFDVGYVRSKYRDLLFIRGGDEARGRKFFATTVRRLMKVNKGLIPYAFLLTGAKYLGYKAGYYCYGRSLPVWLMSRLSSQDYYWQPGGAGSR